MSDWYHGPSLGPFANTLNPIISSLLGILVFGGIVACVYYMVLGMIAWIKAKKMNNSYNMNHAEDQLLPPVIALVVLSILPALVGGVMQLSGTGAGA